MANPGRVIIGVLIIVAFVVLRAAPSIAKEGTYVSQALNSIYITHPFFMVIAVLLGMGIIFSGLKM